MEDFISADPCQFEHAALFRSLQNLTLDFRMADIHCSLVYFVEMKKLMYKKSWGFRVGLVQAKYSSLTSIAPDILCVLRIRR